MRLYGLGLTGVDDQTTLVPGQLLTFEVTGAPCSGISSSDIANTLQNWTGDMMSLKTIGNTTAGYLPGVVDVQVTAVVLSPVTAGSLRGQIMSALSAMQPSQVESTVGLLVGGMAPGAGVIGLCPGGVSLKDGVLSIGSGSSGNAPGGPGTDIPWSIVIPGALLLLGVVLLTGQRR